MLAVVKIRYVRGQDPWRRYWQWSDLRCHAYGPHPVAATLGEARVVIDHDQYACFFG